MYVYTGATIAALPVQSTWIKEEVNKIIFFKNQSQFFFKLQRNSILIMTWNKQLNRDGLFSAKQGWFL